ncbi:unnamed protein product, partial [Owenia fusiformis]
MPTQSALETRIYMASCPNSNSLDLIKEVVNDFKTNFGKYCDGDCTVPQAEFECYEGLVTSRLIVNGELKESHQQTEMSTQMEISTFLANINQDWKNRVRVMAYPLQQ